MQLHCPAVHGWPLLRRSPARRGHWGGQGALAGGLWRGPPGAGLPWKAGVSCPRPGRQAGACLLAWEADASADSSPGAGGGRAGAAAGAAPRLPPRSLPRPAGREAPSGLPVSRARFSQASRAHGRGLAADPGAPSWQCPGQGQAWGRGGPLAAALGNSNTKPPSPAAEDRPPSPLPRSLLTAGHGHQLVL